MEKDFNVDDFKEAVKDLRPTDGSDWDAEKRKMFAQEIFPKEDVVMLIYF